MRMKYLKQISFGKFELCWTVVLIAVLQGELRAVSRQSLERASNKAR